MSAPVAELTRQLPDGGADIVDVHDVAAALTALGVTDRTARTRYELPSLHALSRVLLVQLARTRRVPVRRQARMGAAVRAARFAGPACAAVAAAPVLRSLDTAAAAALLLVGWPAALALGHAAAVLRGRAGRPAAARLIAGGFGVLAAGWCVLVAVGPLAAAVPIGAADLAAVVPIGAADFAAARAAGTSLAGSAFAGVTALAAVAALVAAPVLGSATEMVRWSVPLYVLAAVQLTPGRFDAATAGRVAAAATLLMAARILAPALRRARRTATGDSMIDRPGGVATGGVLRAADLRRAASLGLLGAALATGALWLCHTGPAPANPPTIGPAATGPAGPSSGSAAALVALLPLVVAVPAADAFAGWHAGQVAGARAAAESMRGYARRLRRITVTTVTGLLPFAAVGTALLAAAHRTAGSARDAALALSAGCLFGGVVAVAMVLAARGRPLLGGALAVAAPLAASWAPDGASWASDGSARPQVWLVGAGAAGLALILVRPVLRRGRHS